LIYQSINMKENVYITWHGVETSSDNQVLFADTWCSSSGCGTEENPLWLTDVPSPPLQTAVDVATNHALSKNQAIGSVHVNVFFEPSE